MIMILIWLINHIVRVPWLLYGSTKSETKQPYKITRIYDENLEKLTIKKAFSDYKIFDSDEEEISFEKEIKYYLPQNFKYSYLWSRII